MNELVNRFERRDATITIVGMGRVGLPLAVAFAQAGFRVKGVDVEPARRSAIQLGKLPFHEPGCEEPLRKAVTAGRLTVHASPTEAVPDADAIVLALGTPLAEDLRPDYTQIRAAIAELAPHLRPGQLLVQRSTVSPGTLLKVVRPYLRELLPEKADRLLLAACPERIAEGKAMVELANLPEIVGGVDKASTEAAAALFQSLNPRKLVHRTDPTSAELAKLINNVYRYVNFALANEFAILSEQFGTNIHEVLDMVNREYPRGNVPRPGPAGGPCLSKDGYFLVEELTMPDFVLLAWKLNDSAPAHVVRRLEDRLAGAGVGLAGAQVALLGKAFKRDSDDVRQSPAIRIRDILLREGAEVQAHDPFLPGPTLEEILTGAQAFVLATNHSFYDSLDPHEVAALLDEPRIGMDCWGVLDQRAFAAAGVQLVTFGVGVAR